MNGQDVSLSSPPPISIKFSRVVIFLCDLQLESEVNWFTMKQTRNFIYKISAFLNINVFHNTVSIQCQFALFFLPVIEPTFTPSCKMHTCGSYQLPIEGVPSARKENKTKFSGTQGLH